MLHSQQCCVCQCIPCYAAIVHSLCTIRSLYSYTQTTFPSLIHAEIPHVKGVPTLQMIFHSKGKLAFSEFPQICRGHVQGRTGRLEEVPRGLERGPHMSLSRADALLFMSPVDRTTVLWSLSFKAPESRAAELHTLFKDPTAAQVSHRDISHELVCLSSDISQERLLPVHARYLMISPPLAAKGYKTTGIHRVCKSHP